MTPLDNDPREKRMGDYPYLAAIAGHMINEAAPMRWPTLPDAMQCIYETVEEGWMMESADDFEAELVSILGALDFQFRIRTYQVAKAPSTWNIDPDSDLGKFLVDLSKKAIELC